MRASFENKKGKWERVGINQGPDFINTFCTSHTTYIQVSFFESFQKSLLLGFFLQPR